MINIDFYETPFWAEEYSHVTISFLRHRLRSRQTLFNTNRNANSCIRLQKSTWCTWTIALIIMMTIYVCLTYQQMAIHANILACITCDYRYMQLEQWKTLNSAFTGITIDIRTFTRLRSIEIYALHRVTKDSILWMLVFWVITLG